tara:strand:+ start:728 stop:907 length:180 start_codon:yes stop_codon:yes gene_type:complete
METLLITIVPSILILLFFVYSDRFKELKKIGKNMEGNKVKKLEVLSRLLSFLGYDKPVN